ncbi:rcc01693 family protein [Thalassorhabdomicrobium marinisediminis]|nr:rcc01693 family protein [Thalassorhabdomicrobium marinisediminis]
MSGPEPALDWPALMRAGLRDLGLAPDVFWALTPAELWLMLGADTGTLPMGRRRLDELSAAYPDGGREGDDDGRD